MLKIAPNPAEIEIKINTEIIEVVFVSELMKI